MNASMKIQSRWFGILSLLVLVGVAGCGGGGGSGSDSSGAGGDGAPAAPTALSATTLSESSIRIDWNDTSTDETGFYAERSVSPSGPWTQFALAGNTESTTDTGLDASITYYYRVAAYNASGVSPYVGPVTATTFPPATTLPVAPSSLIATSPASSNSISLSWHDNSDNETGFRIERAASSSGPFTEIVVVGAGSTTYTNTGLAASTTYHYRVRAYNSAGSSAYSNPASATTHTVTTLPAPPSGLTAAATSTSSISISWTDASTNETGFRIERAASSSGPFTEIVVVGAGSTTYTNTGLAASTTYHYRVRAYNSAGSSAYSNPASATTHTVTTLPIPPSGLTAAATSTSSISISWTDASTNETGFRIERAASSSGPFTEIVVVGAGSTTYTNTGLAASTTYHYRVRAYNSAGSSAYSNPASATTHTVTTLPAPPSTLTATATSSSSIRLSWTDTSNNETGFKVDRSTASTGPWTQIATTSAGVVIYSSTGLTESTRYYYRVRATNSAGDSTPSNVANATTAPAAPTSLVATALSGISISLSWTDNSSGEFGFLVERAPATTGPFSIVSVMPGPGPVTVGTNVTTYTDTGLSLSTTYYYRVRAVGLGGSSVSTVASATTPATLPQTKIRIINNASPALLLKDVVRLKLALNVNGFGNADLLSDDRFTTCQSFDDFSYISPGGSSTFDQTIGPNYSVFIGMGVWQTDFGSCPTVPYSWSRRTSFVNAADPSRLNYVFVEIGITNHTGGIVDFAISGSYLNGSLRATLSQDGVVFATIPFQILTQ